MPVSSGLDTTVASACSLSLSAQALAPQASGQFALLSSQSVPATPISGHLELTREAGVVTIEPGFTYYRLAPEALQGAALHLADLAADARAHAGAFRSC